MSFLHTVVSFIVALGVLIVVHEYGHYLMARLCNVRVLRFSVGFGRSLATWRLGPDATEWTIAVIPFGGYVKMLDEREAPVDAGRTAARLQPAKRLAALPDRRRRAAVQFPVRHRGLRRPLHVRPAGGAAGAGAARRRHPGARRRLQRRRHGALDRRRCDRHLAGAALARAAGRIAARGPARRSGGFARRHLDARARPAQLSFRRRGERCARADRLQAVPSAARPGPRPGRRRRRRRAGGAEGGRSRDARRRRAGGGLERPGAGDPQPSRLPCCA